MIIACERPRSPMSRQKRKPPPSCPPTDDTPVTAPIPLRKRVWVVATAVGAIAFTLGLNGPTLLQNIRKLPAELEMTRDQYLGWLKEDAAWTGHWSTFPEGVVDIADMKLSEGVDLKISLQAKNGEVGGTIASGTICSQLPIFDFLLLRGSVSGNVANMEVWDIIGGHARVFERFKLVRENDIITVLPDAGDRSWFTAGARLGRHPDEDESFMQDFCKRHTGKEVPR